MLSQLRKSYDLRLWRPRIFSKLSLFFEEKWKMCPSRGRRGSKSYSKYLPYIDDLSPRIGDKTFRIKIPLGELSQGGIHAVLNQFLWRKRPFSRRSGAEEEIPGPLAHRDFEVLAPSI